LWRSSSIFFSRPGSERVGPDELERIFFSEEGAGKGVRGQSRRTRAATAERCSREVTFQALLVMRKEPKNLIKHVNRLRRTRG
jgi:hypothetical protein